MESGTNMTEKESVKEMEVVLCQDSAHAQRPLSTNEKDVENGAASEGGLPFSKARCITLVLTVTGAAFLNVRVPLLHST